jgi:hypothetical protein
MTEIDHLNQERNVLPIQQHANMVSQQYALVCHRHIQPGFKHTTMEQAPQHMKDSLACVFPVVRHLTNEGVMNNLKQYKDGIKNIQSSCTRQIVKDFNNNKILNYLPPMIDKSDPTY